MSYEPPLRCQRCGRPIERKAGAKTPKYCASCRKKQQDAWREKQKTQRR